MGQYTLAEILTVQVERPPVAIEGLLCERQNAVFSGAYGTGKTMFWLQASLCLSTGRDLLGRKILRPYRTAYLDYENDIGDIKERLRHQSEGLGLRAGDTGENLLYYSASDPDDPLHGILLDLAAGDSEIHPSLEPLSEFVERNQPEFLIIDNLGLVCSSELKEPEDVKRLRQNLKRLRARHECLQRGSIVLLHHLTKPQNSPGGPSLLQSPREFLRQTRGSGRLLDYMEGRLGFSHETISGGLTAYVINGFNRSTAVTPLLLEFDTESLLFSVPDDDQLRLECLFANAPKKRSVATAIKQLPGEFSYTQAEQMVDPETGRPFNNKTVTSTLHELCTNKLLDRTPAGRYRKTSPLLCGAAEHSPPAPTPTTPVTPPEHTVM